MLYPKQAANISPLLLNESTGEPYLQLPSPHDNVIITPARPGDVDPIVEYLGDPRVMEWLASVPHPYTQQDGQKWVDIITARSQVLFHRLEEGDRFVDGCPVQCIREVQADGTDVFIGDVSISRQSPEMLWVSSEDVNNMEKPAGDPTIIWTIGFYLATSHHRRGIMSAALRTLIEAWAIPRMACKRIVGTAMLGNSGSVGVFTKVGFKHTRDVENAIRLPEGRGGEWKSLHLMEWMYSEKLAS